MKQAITPDDRLVRFDNRTFKVTTRKGDRNVDEVALQEITAEDLAEMVVLGAVHENMFCIDLEKTLDVAKNELLEQGKKNLMEISLKALGFDNKWGKWELLTSNGVPTGTVGSVLSAKFADFMIKEQINMDTIMESQKEELKTIIIQQMAKQAREQVTRYDFRRWIENIIAQELKEQVTTYVKRHIIDMCFRQMKGKKVSANDILKGMLLEQAEERLGKQSE